MVSWAKSLARLPAVVIACVAPFATAAAADQIAMRFDMFGLMGVRVLTLHTQVERQAERYAVMADFATTGVAGLVVDQAAHAIARGRLAPASAIAETYLNHSRRNGVERRSRVDYHPDGSVTGSTTPALATPIPPDAARGTVDNLTAYLRLERQLAATRTCALTVAVFDGRQRYDLVFTDAGQQVLAPEGGQNFAGVTTACKMTRYDRIAETPEQGEGARQGTIWYAALVPGGDILLPVRMRLKTQIGDIDGYLVELQGRGVKLRLMD